MDDNTIDVSDCGFIDPSLISRYNLLNKSREVLLTEKKQLQGNKKMLFKDKQRLLKGMEKTNRKIGQLMSMEKEKLMGY